MLFDQRCAPLVSHQLPIQQYFPEPGWVEHDALEIWQTTLDCCRAVIKAAAISARDIIGIGITNQRETTVIWDRATGRPIHHAIVWQDRRTAEYCRQNRQLAEQHQIAEKTGLLLDPYFSATKMAWLLDHVPEARKRAQQSELAFGTIDSWLLWQLTGGKVHATDATNAARTLLFNIQTGQWDDDLLNFFDISKSLLPEVKDNCAEFGSTAAGLFDAEIPICAMAGDQHAALFGQACYESGMIKSTYGTGCFVVLNTGEQQLNPPQSLLSTIGYRLDGQTTYAIEGSIFSAGTIVKWLRDNLGLLHSAAESEQMAQSVTDTDGVVMVPAFTGLGAPYWQPNVRAALFGMSRGTKPAHIVRAGLEAIAYQTRDLLDAMSAGGEIIVEEIRVDGGMVANEWLLQFLADVLNVQVQPAKHLETTAVGVAYMVALQKGLVASLAELAELWQASAQYRPEMNDQERQRLYGRWQATVARLIK